MNQSTRSPRPRFVVREKASKTGRGTWCVVDRARRRVDSRYINEATARQVAEELSAIERDRLADGLWPLATYSERWTITPPIPPAETSDVDEVSPQDRRDWAAMSNQGDDVAEWDEAHHGTLLASLDSGLGAFLDRIEADYLERDIPEPELAECGVIARR